MRILLINYEFPPLGGGGGVVAKEMALGYIALGHDVDYVTTWFSGLKEYENVDGINIYRVKVPGRKDLPTATLPSLVLFPYCARKMVYSLCKKNKYDFINSHFAIPSAPVGIWAAKKFKLPHLLHVQGGDVYDPSKRFSPHRWAILRAEVNHVLNNVDSIAVSSSDMKNRIHSIYHCKVPVNIIPLAYNRMPFDAKTRHELSLSEDCKYLISVGRLVRRKGYDTLIRALSLIDDPHVKLLLIGDGPEKQNLVSLAEELGVLHRITLLGAVSNEQKFQYLNAADMYIMSSVHEGFGIVLQEAMQVGLPIVSTNVGGHIDFVLNNQNGLLVDVGDSKAMAESIEKILADQKLSSFFSANNREKISDFSTSKICQRNIDLIK